MLADHWRVKWCFSALVTPGLVCWPVRLRVWRRIPKYRSFAAKPDFDALIFSDQLGDFALIGLMAVRLVTPCHCNFRQQRTRQVPGGF